MWLLALMSQVCGDETRHKSLLSFSLQLDFCLHVSGMVLWPLSAPWLLAWRARGQKCRVLLQGTALASC